MLMLWCLGPALGPIFGGYLNEGLGWRSIFWFLTILCFVIWIAIIIFLPETRYDVSAKKEPLASDSSSERTTSEQHPKTDRSRRHRFMNPIAALNFMQYPNIALSVLFLGILQVKHTVFFVDLVKLIHDLRHSFFVYYLLNSNFTRIYNNQYGFDSGTVGLFYLPLAGGFIIGSLVGGRYSDRLFMHRAAKMKEINQSPYPELRIGGFLIYACMVVLLLAYIAFGWCVEMNVHYSFGLVCAGISKYSHQALRFIINDCHSWSLSWSS